MPFARNQETDHNVRGIIQGQMDTPLNGQGRRQASATGRALAKEHIDVVYSSPLQRTADVRLLRRMESLESTEFIGFRSINPHPFLRPVHQTALAIIHQHSSVKPMTLHLDPRLKERFFGSLEGKVTRAVNNAKNFLENDLDVEEIAALSERVAAFWNDLVSQPDGNWLRDVGGETHQVETMSLRSDDGSQQSDSGSALNGEDFFKTILVIGHGAALGALLDVIQGYAFSEAGLKVTRLWNCSITEVHVPMCLLPDPVYERLMDNPEQRAQFSTSELSQRKVGRFQPSHKLAESKALWAAYRAAERHYAAEHERSDVDSNEEQRREFLASVKLSAFPEVQEARISAEAARRARAQASKILFVRWADIRHLMAPEEEDTEPQSTETGAGRSIAVTKVANADEAPAAQ